VVKLSEKSLWNIWKLGILGRAQVVTWAFGRITSVD